MVDEKNNNDEYEEVISSYYEGRGVSSMISLNVDTMEADTIAEKLSGFDNIEDVFLVTGDVDIIVKARFKDYDHMKKFLLNKVSQLDGVENLQSQMIITTYKERNQIIAIENSPEE
ncbi:MAG: Lrp/AsnC ligand binding domain-containing protein [Candidatus Saliniplasma sp.]